MSDTIFLRKAEWLTINQLAAELVLVHNVKYNDLQKIMQHILSEQMDYEGIMAWLDARVRYANLFPRTRQTAEQIWTARAVVQYIGEKHAEDWRVIATLLGWIVRKMQYFGAFKSRARSLTRQPVMDVPSMPQFEQVSVPEAPAEDPIPTVDDDEPATDFARSFMKKLKERQQTDDDDED